MKSDIVIIGGGPGGTDAAAHAIKNGLTVTLIEEDKLGGVCLNEGCMPTKTFHRNASILNDLSKADVFGLNNLSYSFDFKKVIDRKNEVVSKLTEGLSFLTANKQVTFVKGKARLKDAHAVVVDGIDYEGDNLIIATGSVTKYLNITGVTLPGVLSSKEILDIDHVPRNLCIIGAGVIGLEFASIFNAFGSRITVLEYAKNILPSFDSDLSKRLKQVLSGRGINIINQAEVSEIKQKSDCLSVSYSCKGEAASTEAEIVLMAVGRVPNFGSLNLSDLAIQCTPKGIMTNEFMQTNIPSIYAIGDINGRCMLAHAASFQGIKAIDHILGKEDRIDLDIMPAAVFTLPEAATVGLTEEQCKDKRLEYKAKKLSFRGNGKALTMDETDGLCKIIVDGNCKIIGCHMFGEHTSDLIHEISALMNKNATIDDLKNIIHTHPTLSEIFQSCSREF